jgi:hypothetical protein
MTDMKRGRPMRSEQPSGIMVPISPPLPCWLLDPSGFEQWEIRAGKALAFFSADPAADEADYPTHVCFVADKPPADTIGMVWELTERIHFSESEASTYLAKFQAEARERQAKKDMTLETAIARAKR